MRHLMRKYPTATIEGFQADLSLMPEVEELADLVKEKFPVIHAVIHNAATIDGDFKGRRKETFGVYHEHTMAVNTYAPFLLTSLLLDNLRASGCGRVIFSGSETMGAEDALDDLNFEEVTWTGNR